MGAVKPLVIVPRAGGEPAAERKSSPKSETSRIPLEMATAMTGAPAGKPSADLKTIKIKPSASGGSQTTPIVMEPSPAGALSTKPEDKRKTSRISLESALAIEENKAGQPKTIRLKKPSEAATIKAAPALDTIKVAPKPGLGQTARLDDQAEEAGEDSSTPTRRKTIKVKRPTDRPSVAVPAASIAGRTTGVGVTVEAADEDSGISWFSVVALIAAILTLVMSVIVIYMLSAQAFGPNPCLTELASGAPTLDLGWTGKIQPLNR